MADVCHSVDFAPTYDLSFFIIGDDDERYVEFKKLYVSLRDFPKEDAGFIRETLSKFLVCPDTITHTLNNPHFFLPKLQNLLDKYENRHPGASHFYQTLQEFETIAWTPGVLPLAKLVWLALTITPTVCRQFLNYYQCGVTDDAPLSLLTPSYLLNEYRNHRFFEVRLNGIMKHYPLDHIRIPPSAYEALEYARVAARYNRVDVIAKIYDTIRQIDLDEQRVHGKLHMMSEDIVIAATKYGSIHILQYVKVEMKYSETNRLEINEIKDLVPLNVEISEFLLTFVQISSVIHGALQQDQLEFYLKNRELIMTTEDEIDILESAIYSGSINLVEMIMRPDLEFPFEDAVYANAFDLFVHFFEKMSDQDLEKKIELESDQEITVIDEIYIVILYNKRPLFLRYLYDKNIKFSTDGFKEYIVDLENTHGSEYIRNNIIQNLNTVVSWMTYDDRQDEQFFSDLRGLIVEIETKFK